MWQSYFVYVFIATKTQGTFCIRPKFHQPQVRTRSKKSGLTYSTTLFSSVTRTRHEAPANLSVLLILVIRKYNFWSTGWKMPGSANTHSYREWYCLCFFLAPLQYCFCSWFSKIMFPQLRFNFGKPKYTTFLICKEIFFAFQRQNWMNFKHKNWPRYCFQDFRHKIWQLLTFFRRVFIYFVVITLVYYERLDLPSWGRLVFKVSIYCISTSI